jgi:hypothetical protein
MTHSFFNGVESGFAVLQCVFMMTREQQTTFWANAYNAALTGLLASKSHHMEMFTKNNVLTVTNQCKVFADQALQDVKQHEN